MAEDHRHGITILHDPQQFITQQQEPLQVAFDLVAIHGLNGHSHRTWTHHESNVMWLKELLPSSLPNVRVMTFGYNAAFRNFTGHQDLRHIATKLLSELADLRASEDEINRRLVFICHSLGGIVAKKALLVRVSEDLTRVQNAVYGILFLATPHHGSGLATCGKTIASIAAACSPLNPATKLLGVLQKDSEALFEIMEDFLVRAKELRLVSFFEMEETTFGVFKRLVVEHRSAVMNLPNEVAIGQNADHRAIARFSSEHDRNFRPVLSRLKLFRDEIVRKFGISLPNVSGLELANVEQTCVPFETPYSLCETFRGREDVLDYMVDYFHPYDDIGTIEPRQLSFAICGLGGSGKTQTALQYSFRNRYRYISGIFFLNASSRTTLAADFDRIYNLLEISTGSNKVDAVRRWLSKVENQTWLLIFDNADDLETMQLSKYFPSVPWGHIILTSRDQAAIGTVVKQGHNLERLELDEAIEVLLEKAGLKDSPKSDYEEARQIVQLLGCLPLAIDQAGAFIKSRRKTLIGYSKLYKERQLELLKFKPRLVEYDKNILTTWEINFAQVERDSQASSDILLLCCFLDGAKIVERMLVEGVSPQVRWGPDGEKVNLAAEEDGVDKDLVALITDEIAFDEAIEKLLSFSLIQCFDTSDGTRTFSVHPLVQYCASQRVPLKRQNKWRSQAIRLVCHAFPREKFLHAVNAHFGATMLPQIDRSLKEYDSGNEQDIGRAATSQYLAETLVSASRFSTTSWKLRCIERAKGLLNSDSHNYLRAAITYRNSSLIRMTGNKEKSNESLKQFIYASDYSKLSLLDPRDNAHRFDLITSYAQNFVQESKLAAAREELSNWLPLNISSPSSMERLALKNRNTTLGKILRYEGQFAEALTYLEYLLEQSNDEDGGVEETPGWRHLLLSNIADLYTELDRPADAEAMLESEIAQMRSENWAESGSSKRLQLSLIEAFMRHNKLQKAVQWLLPLQHHFEKIKEPDVLTKRGLFRVRTTLARVAHFRGQWDKALFNWKEALNVTESLGERESFSGGQVKCAFAYTLYTLGRVAEGLVLFKQAQQNLASQKRFFYLVGFDSYWHDTIMRLVRECYSNQDVVQ